MRAAAADEVAAWLQLCSGSPASAAALAAAGMQPGVPPQLHQVDGLRQLVVLQESAPAAGSLRSLLSSSREAAAAAGNGESGRQQQTLAAGPAWDGWLAAYTRMPQVR